jgi:hypothetical protein
VRGGRPKEVRNKVDVGEHAAHPDGKEGLKAFSEKQNRNSTSNE